MCPVGDSVAAHGREHRGSLAPGAVSTRAGPGWLSSALGAQVTVLRLALVGRRPRAPSNPGGRGPRDAGSLLEQLRGRVHGADSVALGGLSLFCIRSRRCSVSFLSRPVALPKAGRRDGPLETPGGSAAWGRVGSLEKPLVSLVFSSSACGREETWGPFRPL